MFKEIVEFIKDIFGEHKNPIPLHAPVFCGNEKKYINECIDSTFVSSVGEFVDLFEEKVAEFTGAKYAVATVNGTAALHVALLLAGVQRGDEVLTQATSFVATANTISYCGASPVFLDSDRQTLGLSPDALEAFFYDNCDQKDDGHIYNRKTGKRISACVPMHVFGYPMQIERVGELCNRSNVALVEDAAESLGSFFQGRHTGTFGRLGNLSFNGNKTNTTGGGGMILTNEEALGKLAKHLTTTAKVDHPWQYAHDHIGFNYRLPNINAALGCAQMEMLQGFLKKKRELAATYQDFFDSIGISFVGEAKGAKSNYWLNAILFKDIDQRNGFLEYSNAHGVMTRPLWNLTPKLPMYSDCQADELTHARWLEERLVNIPGGHCKSCVDAIEQEGKYSISGIVDLPEKLNNKILGYEIIATDKDLDRLVKTFQYFLITIGQIKLPQKRITLFDRLKDTGVQFPVIISPLAYVSKHARIGEGTIVMHHATVNAGAKVGKNCIINTKALIEHDAVIGDHCHISTGAIVNGGASVGEKTFFGSNSTTREYTEIGKESVIGFNVKVMRNITDGSFIK